MTYNQKYFLRLLLIAGLILTTSIKLNIVGILIVLFMLISLITEFIRAEKTTRGTVSTLFYWFIYVIIVFYWKALPMYICYSIIWIELLKICVITFISVKIKKNDSQNSFIGKLWIIGLFIYMGEIVLNSTFGFYNLYLILTIISLSYIVLKTILGLRKDLPS